MSNEDYNNKEYNPEVRTCRKCGSNWGQCLEDLENDRDVEWVNKPDLEYAQLPANMSDISAGSDSSVILCRACFETTDAWEFQNSNKELIWYTDDEQQDEHDKQYNGE